MLRNILKTEMFHMKQLTKFRLVSILKRSYSGGVEEMAFELNNVFKRYRLQEAPSMTGIISKKDALKIYNDMAAIRRLETIAAGLYREKVIRGFCHLYIGQEACCVGPYSVLSPDDAVITSYRCHGWCYTMGISDVGLMGELAGKRIGVSRGKGGSMHMYAKNFYGGNGIVGAQVPLGTGVAFALQYLNKNAVCLCIYGDGAANQGQFFESSNMACLMKLPVIYVCENNMYGMGTQVTRHSCNTEYFTRGDLIPGLWVDGQNVLAVRNATTFARDYVLKNGPLIVEFFTYRYHGHSMSDPGTSYRTRDEVQQVRDYRDPLKIFRTICQEGSLVTEKEFDEIDEAVRKTIDGRLKNLKGEQDPEMKEMTADIYAKNYEPKIRGVNAWIWYDHYNIAKRHEAKLKATPKDQIKEVKEKDKKSAPVVAEQKDSGKKSKAPKEGSKPSTGTKTSTAPVAESSKDKEQQVANAPNTAKTAKDPSSPSTDGTTDPSQAENSQSVCDLIPNDCQVGQTCFAEETMDGRKDDIHPPQKLNEPDPSRSKCFPDLSTSPGKENLK